MPERKAHGGRFRYGDQREHAGEAMRAWGKLSRVGALALGLAAAARLGDASAAAAPLVSPDRLGDVADSEEDPFPAFADFAWRAFLSLDWPAGPRGAPDRALRLGDPGARVWETFPARYEVFGQGGATPCGAAALGREVSAFTPFFEFNQASFTPDQPDSPLIARNGEYVRYETRFDSIAAQGLMGSTAGPFLAPIGAIAVKAAWRPLNRADPPAARARYYIVDGAEITDVAATRAAGHVVCARADLALVGLHIVVRTPSQPQGVWASFEHVDNVPPVGVGEAREPDARDEGASFSFNDPAASQRDVAPPQGWALARPVTLDNPPRDAPAPMQVIRKHPIRREIMAANRAYWALPEVASSVWRRYMLVSVQWPTAPAPRGPENDGRYFPGLKPEPDSKAAKYKVDEGDDGRNLANTTMETYQQDLPASCMSCHHAISNARGRDFVGVVEFGLRKD